jgi:hypothetical protein
VFIALEEKAQRPKLLSLLKENRAKTFTSTRAPLDIKSARKARGGTNREVHHRGKQRHRTSSLVLTVGHLRLHCNSPKVTPVMLNRSPLPRAYSSASTTSEREDIT